MKLQFLHHGVEYTQSSSVTWNNSPPYVGVQVLYDNLGDPFWTTSEYITISGKNYPLFVYYSEEGAGSGQDRHFFVLDERKFNI